MPRLFLPNDPEREKDWKGLRRRVSEVALSGDVRKMKGTSKQFFLHRVWGGRLSFASVSRRDTARDVLTWHPRKYLLWGHPSTVTTMSVRSRPRRRFPECQKHLLGVVRSGYLTTVGLPSHGTASYSWCRPHLHPSRWTGVMSPVSTGESQVRGEGLFLFSRWPQFR